MLEVRDAPPISDLALVFALVARRLGKRGRDMILFLCAGPEEAWPNNTHRARGCERHPTQGLGPVQGCQLIRVHGWLVSKPCLTIHILS